jgi:flagellin-like protein
MENSQLDIMRKGLSPIVAAVILIAATMSLAGILTFWTTGFISNKLNQSSTVNDETNCLGAEFKLRPESKYSNGTLFLIVENIRAVDLKLENLYLFYPDIGVDTVPLNSFELNKAEIKSLPLDTFDIRDGFTSGKIKTNCPTASLEFTYSNGVIR